MYSTYLFDWDGCIFDSLNIWLELNRTILTHFGVEFDNDDTVQIHTLMADKDVRLDMDAKDPDYLKGRFKEVFEIFVSRGELISGAEEVLRKLKLSGAKIAIVTSSDRANVEAIIRKNNLEELFDTTVCGGEAPKGKPAPDSLFLALSKLGISKDNAVMVGDTYFDIDAGKAAGIDTILLHAPDMHGKFVNLEEIIKGSQPTHIVSDLRDILKL